MSSGPSIIKHSVQVQEKMIPLEKKDYTGHGKPYNVFDYYHTVGVFPVLAKKRSFEYITLFVITLNAMWIGYDTDANPAPDISSAATLFFVVENGFCFFFTFELLIRFLAFKKKRDCLYSGWFDFDAILCGLMIFESWLLPLVLTGGGASIQIGFLRLLRLLRLTRMTRLMRALPELCTLIKGMKAAIRSVMATLVLLILVLYIFGIIFHSQYAIHFEDPRCSECEEMWGSVADSMFTLFVAGTLLDDITAVMAKILSAPAYPWLMVVFFLIYFLLSSLTVLNMLIGVVCEVISDTTSTESENSMVSQVTQILTIVFKEIDTDNSGLISKKEFELMTEKKESLEAMMILGVEPKHLLALSDTLFENADNEFEPRELTFGEFLEMVVHLRPDEKASVLDIAQLRAFQRRLMLQLDNKLGEIAEMLDPKEVNDGTHDWELEPVAEDISLESLEMVDTANLDMKIAALQVNLSNEKKRVEKAEKEIILTQRDITKLLETHGG